MKQFVAKMHIPVSFLFFCFAVFQFLFPGLRCFPRQFVTAENDHVVVVMVVVVDLV